jgi:hypothetical protein
MIDRAKAAAIMGPNPFRHEKDGTFVFLNDILPLLIMNYNISILQKAR